MENKLQDRLKAKRGKHSETLKVQQLTSAAKLIINLVSKIENVSYSFR